MWWPRLAGLLALVLLAGCSFRPLYGGKPGTELRRALATVEIAPQDGDIGQTLRNELIDEINPTGIDAAAVYRLEIDTETAENALLIQLDDTATRYDLSLAANFRIVRKTDAAVLYRSAVRRVASYNVRDEPFATLVARQDAERRAAREIAREIRARLGLWLAARQP